MNDERPSGHWIPNRTPSMDSDWRRKKVSYKIYRCSECGGTNGKYPTPFCPYCGAKMFESEVESNE